MSDITQQFLNPSDDLEAAMKVIDRSGGSLCLVVEPDTYRLIRVVSDGDVRRALISGMSSLEPISKLGSQDPIFAEDGSSVSEMRHMMLHHKLLHLPVVDSFGVPSLIYRRHELEEDILLSPPHLGGSEVDFVNEAIKANWVAPAGPNLNAFEEEFAVHVGCCAAAAVSSGTAALHIALRLCGISSGDLVAVSSFTFVASVNPILYLGGEPVFIDSEIDGWNMCPESLELAFKCAISRGKRIKAVVVVNLYGQSSRMDRIIQVCNNYGADVIEDSAESLGGTYQGRYSGTFGKFGIFSFNGNKIITTSGGGMLVSDDEDAIDRARFLSTQAKEVAPYYQHEVIGYNYRMSNILAGIGRGQLALLGSRVSKRRDIFEYYRSQLDGLSIEWMEEIEGAFSSRWLTAGYSSKLSNLNKVSNFIELLGAKGIECRHLWKPMHTQPVFSKYEFISAKKESVADKLFRGGFCLPSGSSMSHAQLERIVREVEEVFEFVSK